MIPVPDYPGVDTPYGRRGSYWSCDRDAQGNGIHTGADFQAPTGAKVVAARPGTLAWCNHGSSFGGHQVEVRCTDGTRDFYAHLSKRVDAGDVKAGEKIGEVGQEGNATGPH
ncbi:MAG TPA: M23 family metallopeptidase, partial [Myxococcaceae bacterium]|nr:M23 family metallopeptidase [Myxococcaceae bacterium]